MWGLSGIDIMVKYVQCRIYLFCLQLGGVIQLQEPYGVCKGICKYGCLHTRIVQVSNIWVFLNSYSGFIFILKNHIFYRTIKTHIYLY